MREAAAGLSAILDIEMNLKLCAGWGLSPSDLEQTPPAVEMLAYTRYVLDAGMRGDLLALKVALAPCVIGYAEIATRLTSRAYAHAETNPYRVWNRRVCRCTIPGGCGESAGAPGGSRRSLRHAGPRGRADCDLQGSHPARGRNSRAKLVAGWTGANERTVKNWILGRYSPCGRHLVVLAQHSDKVLNAILTMADRRDLLLAQKAKELRRMVSELTAIVGKPRM